jgi:lysophospholipid acyltransferase (LPLAT)-like uncharacterized protein
VSLSQSRQLKAAVIAEVAWPVVEALGATWHWREVGPERLESAPSSGREPILALWHGRILPATLFFRDRGVVAMTSENFDGEWVARTMRRFGYRAARGSTSRGGRRALVELRQALLGGSPVAFTVDGPQGPAREAQPGALWLAGSTGCPVVPFHIEASDFWTVSSWDRHQIPKPGSHVAVAIGEPIIVESTDETVVEAARQDLEGSLTYLERVARRALAPDTEGSH